MRLLELVSILAIFSVLTVSVLFYFRLSTFNTSLATQSIAYAMHRARGMALVDSNLTPVSTLSISPNIPSLNSDVLFNSFTPHMWQLQFHLGGIYTENSMSIYKDTPRNVRTTHYDMRPMAGDVLALDALSAKCLSGYNNTNIAAFCRNNAHFNYRLKESLGIQTIMISSNANCFERESSRFYFDSLGRVYCGGSQERLRAGSISLANFKIVLEPKTGFSYVLKD
ncbi:hypothetical protein BKH43_06575 [Helicobacter sp. 13S00401-1]|uniref:hypothetical protein n=1 Tax=Helicobacter sp. 13S00401-1 TaxID=1905758 RepID=UPI000BA71102|nr:hypothetical protein [Helicobacter sp. 13S00401-1]PAF49666.1 hypothetical protein BKH43_06575 [Helicobacter sp. 13S00401-1]